jgi:hypothetical protein
MSDIPKESIQQWLAHSLLEDGHDTSRGECICGWLATCTEELPNSKRAGGYSGWQYQMAITMVPYFPEVVADMTEEGEITFNWKMFDQILMQTFAKALHHLAHESNT